MCLNGHCVCKHCQPKVNRCPQCRDGNSYRCYAMERIHGKLKLPCKYEKEGCSVTTVDYANIEEHETVCKHNTTRCCPLAHNPCNWNGKYEDMFAHIHAKHSRLILPEDKFVTTLDSAATKTEVAFIKKYNNIFQVIFSRNAEFFKIVVQFVGFPDEFEAFIYKTEIVKDKKKSWVITESCERLEDLNTAFENYKGVSIPEGKMQQFYDSNAKVTINILNESDGLNSNINEGNIG